MTLSLTDIITIEEFQRLKSLNNAVALSDLLKRLFLNILLVWIMLQSSQFDYLLMLFFWYLYSFQFQFWGYVGLGHEALHGRIFSSKKANEVLYFICSALTWNNGAMFRDTHLLHHRSIFSVEDTEAESETRWSIWDIIGYILIDIRALFRRIYYTLINSLGFYPNFVSLNNKYKFSARITLLLNIFVYAFFYTITQNITVTLLLLIAPFSNSLAVKILAKAQHHGLDKFKDRGPLKFSRTLELPIWLRFLYANMNYHAEHHFSPVIPYYKLPKLHNLLKNKGLVNSQSLFEFLFSSKKNF